MKRRIIMGMMLLSGIGVMQAADAPPQEIGWGSWISSAASKIGGAVGSVVDTASELKLVAMAWATPDAELEKMVEKSEEFQKLPDFAKQGFILDAIKNLITKQKSLNDIIRRRAERMGKFSNLISSYLQDARALSGLESFKVGLREALAEYDAVLRESVAILDQAVSAARAVSPVSAIYTYTPSPTPSSGGTGAAVSPR